MTWATIHEITENMKWTEEVHQYIYILLTYFNLGDSPFHKKSYLNKDNFLISVIGVIVLIGGY